MAKQTKSWKEQLIEAIRGMSDDPKLGEGTAVGRIKKRPSHGGAGPLTGPNKRKDTLKKIKEAYAKQKADEKRTQVKGNKKGKGKKVTQGKNVKQASQIIPKIPNVQKKKTSKTVTTTAKEVTKEPKGEFKGKKGPPKGKVLPTKKETPKMKITKKKQEVKRSTKRPYVAPTPPVPPVTGGGGGGGAGSAPKGKGLPLGKIGAGVGAAFHSPGLNQGHDQIVMDRIQRQLKEDSRYRPGENNVSNQPMLGISGTFNRPGGQDPGGAGAVPGGMGAGGGQTQIDPNAHSLMGDMMKIKAMEGATPQLMQAVAPKEEDKPWYSGLDWEAIVRGGVPIVTDLLTGSGAGVGTQMAGDQLLGLVDRRMAEAAEEKKTLLEQMKHRDTLASKRRGQDITMRGQDIKYDLGIRKMEADAKKALKEQGVKPALANTMFNQYSSHKVVKEMTESAGAIRSLASNLENPTGGGDITFLYDYIKAVDPTSVVKIEEVRLVQTAEQKKEIIENWMSQYGVEFKLPWGNDTEFIAGLSNTRRLLSDKVKQQLYEAALNRYEGRFDEFDRFNETVNQHYMRMGATKTNWVSSDRFREVLTNGRGYLKKIRGRKVKDAAPESKSKGTSRWGDSGYETQKREKERAMGKTGRGKVIIPPELENEVEFDGDKIVPKNE